VQIGASVRKIRQAEPNEPAMPRATIPILVRDTGPFEGASWLLSHIVYPDDSNRCIPFTAALCRVAHLQTVDMSPDWAATLHQIRPWIFTYDDTTFHKSLTVGFNILYRRLATALIMIHPHLHGLLKGKPPTRLNGFAPTVGNAAAHLMNEFGWKGDSEATFKSRIWGPMKPVSHVAYVTSVRVFKATQSKPYEQRNLLAALFPSESELLQIISLSEQIRLRLPEIKQFRIKEKDTFKFEVV
jgi:hypothetical protein